MNGRTRIKKKQGRTDREGFVKQTADSVRDKHPNSLNGITIHVTTAE